MPGKNKSMDIYPTPLSALSIENGSLMATLNDNRVINCGTIPALTGPPGTSLSYLYIDELGNLHAVYNDSKRSCLGVVRGPPGPAVTGPRGAGVQAVHVNLRGQLSVTDTDGRVCVTQECLFGPTGPRGAQGPAGDATSTGATGPTGAGFSSAYVDDAGEVHFVMDNGRVVSAGTVMGPTGVSLVSAQVQQNGRLAILLDNGARIDAGHVRGPTGAGLASMQVQEDGSLLCFYTDGRVARTGLTVNVATGPTGAGATGPPGVGLSRLDITSAGDLVATYTNTVRQQLGNIRGPTGPAPPPTPSQVCTLQYTKPSGTAAGAAAQNLLGRYPFNNVARPTPFLQFDVESHTFALSPGTYTASYTLVLDVENTFPVMTALREVATRAFVANINTTANTFCFTVDGNETYEIVYYIDTRNQPHGASSMLGKAAGLVGCAEVYGSLTIAQLY